MSVNFGWRVVLIANTLLQRVEFGFLSLSTESFCTKKLLNMYIRSLDSPQLTLKMFEDVEEQVKKLKSELRSIDISR